jgi:hypothetical protein
MDYRYELDRIDREEAAEEYGDRQFLINLGWIILLSPLVCWILKVCVYGL